MVAERAGYNNANTAKVRFGQIKRALGFSEDGTMSATPTPPKSRGKKATTVGSGTNETPTKVTKKRAPAKKKAKNFEVEAEVDAQVDAEMTEEQDDAETNMEYYASHESGYEHVKYYDDE